MRWDYGKRVERILTTEEDFEEGIGRFLDDENGEPDVLPLSDPFPEMWFPPDSADYETERYLAQRFGIIKFRQYFGLDPLLKHHGELRTLTGAMIRTRKNLDEIRTMVLRVRAERLADADWDSARGKRMTSQGDVLRVCAWLRSEQEDGSERSAGEARGVEGSTSWKRTEGRGGGSEGAIDLTTPPVRRVKLRIGNPTANQGQTSGRDTSGDGATSTASTLVQEPTISPTGTTTGTVNPVPPPAPPVAPTPRMMTAMDKLMLSSFKSISDSAPSALEAGQEMVLRIGRNADGAFYFKHDVHQHTSTSRVGYPYRLDGVTLENVDEVLGLKAVLPRPPVD